MSFSISVDWSEETYNKETGEENYINIGRQTAEENCTHKTQDNSNDKETNMRYSGYCDECGFGEDSCNPMMNYAYPLETEPSEEAIKKVINNTNCTVMKKESTDEYFLALCGGGMDLSQDIALAYIYCEKWLPKDLLTRVCEQPCLSVGSKAWKTIARTIIEQSKNEAINLKANAQRWKEKLTKFKTEEKNKKVEK